MSTLKPAKKQDEILELRDALLQRSQLLFRPVVKNRNREGELTLILLTLCVYSNHLPNLIQRSYRGLNSGDTDKEKACPDGSSGSSFSGVGTTISFEGVDSSIMIPFTSVYDLYQAYDWKDDSLG